MGSISASEANRHFSALLRRVQQGETVTITSRGRVVAEMRPATPTKDEAARKTAWRALLEHLREARPFEAVGPWTREELYERDPKR